MICDNNRIQHALLLIYTSLNASVLKHSIHKNCELQPVCEICIVMVCIWCRFQKFLTAGMQEYFLWYFITIFIFSFHVVMNACCFRTAVKVCGDKVYQEINILGIKRYMMIYTLYQVTMWRISFVSCSALFFNKSFQILLKINKNWGFKNNPASDAYTCYSILSVKIYFDLFYEELCLCEWWYVNTVCICFYVH